MEEKKRGSFNREVRCLTKPQEKHFLGSTPACPLLCPSSPYPISGYSSVRVTEHFPSPLSSRMAILTRMRDIAKTRNQPKYPVLTNALQCRMTSGRGGMPGHTEKSTRIPGTQTQKTQGLKGGAHFSPLDSLVDGT